MEVVSLVTMLGKAAQAGSLLIGLDYDGTLAPIVSDPSSAKPYPGIVSVLEKLSKLGSTNLAIISGRSLENLQSLIELPSAIDLYGSHGLENMSALTNHAKQDSLVQVGSGAIEDLACACAQVSLLANSFSGVHIESKPYSFAVHYRNLRDNLQPLFLSLLLGRLSEDKIFSPLHILHGKKVVEISAISFNKGSVIEAMRGRSGHQSMVIYAGDDQTDEDAFSVLASSDISIKVGPGSTCARYRVAGPEAILNLLLTLLRQRSQACHLRSDSPPVSG